MDAPMSKPQQLARNALLALPELQRLAIVNLTILEAVCPHSVQQLRRASQSAKIAADDLERDASVRRALSDQASLSGGSV